MKIRRLGGLVTALGECPVWHAGNLWLLDCRRGLIYRLDPDSGEVMQRYEAPAPLGAFAFNGDDADSIVLALKDEIVTMDLRSGQRRTLARREAIHPNLRWNDGTALPDGSFLVGTMHVYRQPDEAPLGGLYRLHTDLRLEKVDAGYGITNGPCVNPVNNRVYVADSAAMVIYSYARRDDGALSDRQVFLKTDVYSSGPDGCAFDRDGGLWVTLVRAGALARFDMAGRLTHRIDLPVTYPSAVCFGGPDRADVFVTSISDSGRLRASGPMDGAVLKIVGLGFRGCQRPVCRFSG